MRFLQAFSILLWASTSLSFESYYELEVIKATCYPRDSCSYRMNDDPLGIGNMFSCSCGRTCSQIDACCIDSLSTYRVTSSRLTCRKVNVEDSDEGKGCFMMDRCPSGGVTNPVWKTLCEDEWDGEDDVMKRVPVTSVSTSITYKNFFCFRCNEAGQEFRYWNVRLKYQTENAVEVENRHVALTFNRSIQSWMAPLGTDGSMIPVDLRVEIPDAISRLVKMCELNLISECAKGWEHKLTERACKKYMAIIYIPKRDVILKYRNPHCAFCNFETLEDLDNMTCTNKGVVDPGADEAPASFSYLLDVTRSGDAMDRYNIYTNNFLWDPFKKCCRNDVCKHPAYMLENGKCRSLKFA